MSGFNIPLGADTATLEKDMARAAQVTQRTTDLMAQSVGVVNAKQMLLNQTLGTQLANVQKLSAKYGENSAEALKMAASAERTRMQLAQMVQPSVAIGNATQKASGQFNGLGNSINQLTREMPAFANSVQTGFMAISNNLPIFFDQISQLKKANVDLVASGQPAKSIMGQLGASIFSWNTALSVGITALTVLAPKIWDWAAGLSAVNDETKINIKFSDEQTKAIMAQVEAIKERNNQLGITIQSLKTGKTEDEVVLKNERNKLIAYEKTLEKLKQLNDQKLRAGVADPLGIIGMTPEIKKQLDLEAQRDYVLSKEYETNVENIKLYSQKVEAQRKLVAQLNEEAVKTKEIAALKKPKPVKIEAASDDFLKNARQALTQYEQFSKIIGKNSGVALAAGIAATDLKVKLDFREKEVYTKAIDIGKAIGQAFSSAVVSSVQNGALLVGETIGAMFTGNANAATFFDGLIGIVTNFMQTLGGAMVAAGVAVQLFETSLFSGNGVGAIAAGAGLIAAAGLVKSIMKGGIAGNNNGVGGGQQRSYGFQDSNLPKMADGGLLYGRTAFVGGEYAGASSNPEVVAPLNKLRSILGAQGGGMVKGVASGRELRLVSIREANFRKLNYGN